MDSDNANNTSTNSKEQVTALNDDDTTEAVEPEVPSEPAMLDTPSCSGHAQ